MRKQGGIHKGWSKRWFILSASTLFYFQNENDIDPRGFFPLENVEVMNTTNAATTTTIAAAATTTIAAAAAAATVTVTITTEPHHHHHHHHHHYPRHVDLNVTRNRSSFGLS